MNITLRNEMLTHMLFRKSYQERCGVVLGHRNNSDIDVVRFVEVRNVHPEPETAFRMTKGDVQQALRRTLTNKVGYWHTHFLPDAPEGPSDTDMEWMARYPLLVGLVVHVPTTTLTWFDAKNIIKKMEVNDHAWHSE